MRESAAGKGRRLLIERRVTVVGRDRLGALLRVRGDSASYLVEHDARGWRCGCPAFGARCSHILAAQYVIDPTVMPRKDSR